MMKMMLPEDNLSLILDLLQADIDRLEKAVAANPDDGDAESDLARELEIYDELNLFYIKAAGDITLTAKEMMPPK